MRLFYILLLFQSLGSCNNFREQQNFYDELLQQEQFHVRMVSTEDNENLFYTLHGRALDQDTGEGIIALKMKFMRKDGTITGVLTDINGYYTIDLQPGVYVLEISYPGYEKYTTEITALEGMREEMIVTAE